LWDYAHPATTEKRFKKLLPEADRAGDLDYRLGLLTQIARTHSLRAQFEKAHSVLDAVERELCDETCQAEIRYLLERGRTYTTARKSEKAVPLFRRAWDLACARGYDFLAIDAAHMRGIATPPAEQLTWNHKALQVAETSSDGRARQWLGVLYHNTGMTHLDAGELEMALEQFQKDYEFRQVHGTAETARTAKWCVAHTLRLLGRLDEALRMQLELEEETARAGGADGFVHEELGEIYLARGETEAARAQFRKAWELLSTLRWLQQSDPARLERLRKLATSPAAPASEA